MARQWSLITSSFNSGSSSGSSSGSKGKKKRKKGTQFPFPNLYPKQGSHNGRSAENVDTNSANAGGSEAQSESDGHGIAWSHNSGHSASSSSSTYHASRQSSSNKGASSSMYYADADSRRKKRDIHSFYPRMPLAERGSSGAGGAINSKGDEEEVWNPDGNTILKFFMKYHPSREVDGKSPSGEIERPHQKKRRITSIMDVLKPSYDSKLSNDETIEK